jgi:hypothetical protein
MYLYTCISISERIKRENMVDVELHQWALKHSLKLMKQLEDELKEEHGPLMGGHDVFGPIQVS